jgi:hypothetical protein
MQNENALFFINYYFASYFVMDRQYFFKTSIFISTTKYTRHAPESARLQPLLPVPTTGRHRHTMLCIPSEIASGGMTR